MFVSVIDLYLTISSNTNEIDIGSVTSCEVRLVIVNTSEICPVTFRDSNLKCYYWP